MNGHEVEFYFCTVDVVICSRTSRSSTKYQTLPTFLISSHVILHFPLEMTVGLVLRKRTDTDGHDEVEVSLIKLRRERGGYFVLCVCV